MTPDPFSARKKERGGGGELAPNSTTPGWPSTFRAMPLQTVRCLLWKVTPAASVAMADAASGSGLRSVALHPQAVSLRLPPGNMSCGGGLLACSYR